MSDAGESIFDDPNALDPGTRFGELEIIRTLGVGGFGIVYLAKDHALERTVAIKEYMPAQMAQRGQNSHVSVRSSQQKDTFELGLRSFVNEARLLAKFDHKSLLKVYRFWEANGTAYMVMPYLQGKTLKRIREGLVDAPSEAWILKQVLPLLDALSLLHGEKVYHRDISPDNILLPPDGGDPILLDFGAARRVIGDRTQSFTAIFKPSYAPIEQYGETTQLRQGPWTDIYSLGAVLHFLLTGAPPPLATTRAVIDEFEPLAQRTDWPNHTRHFRAAIDWALSVRPAERPHNVGELRDALLGDRTMPQVAQPGHAVPKGLMDEDADMVTLPPQARKKPKPYEATQLIAAPKPTVEQMVVNALGRTQPLPERVLPPHERTQPLAPDGVGAAPARSEPKRRAAAPPSPAAAASAPGAPAPSAVDRKRLLLPLGAGAAVLLLGAFWWVLQGRGPAPEAGLVVSIGAASAVRPADSVASDPVAMAPSAASDVSVAASAPGILAPLASASASAPVSAKPLSARVGTAASAPPRQPRRTEPVVAETPARAEPAPVPPPEVPPVVANPVRSGPQDPRAACGDRVFIAMWRCIDQRCEEPAFAEHPDCQALKARRERRQERNR